MNSSPNCFRLTGLCGLALIFIAGAATAGDHDPFAASAKPDNNAEIRKVVMEIMDSREPAPRPKAPPQLNLMDMPDKAGEPHFDRLTLTPLLGADDFEATQMTPVGKINGSYVVISTQGVYRKVSRSDYKAAQKSTVITGSDASPQTGKAGTDL